MGIARTSVSTNSRPLIAVTGPDGWFPIAWWFIRFGVCLAGGRAVRMTPSILWRERPPDAIIISGGDDIDPSLYLPHPSEVAPSDPARDRLEMEQIEQALRRRIPLLGICRGAQLINVVRQGRLHTDLRRIRKVTSNRRTPFPNKTVTLQTGSRIAQVLGAERVRINSLHHQAVSELGHGLRIVGRDADGIVQAIEDADHRFLIGVQWHPEYLPLHTLQRRIFQHLVKAARLP